MIFLLRKYFHYFHKLDDQLDSMKMVKEKQELKFLKETRVKLLNENTMLKLLMSGLKVPMRTNYVRLFVTLV